VYPIPHGALERYRYLRDTIPGFFLIAQLNSAVHDQYSLYGYNADLAFFAEGRYLGDWFGPARYADFQPSFSGADCASAESPRLVERLVALGVDHYLYPRNLLPRDYRQCKSFARHFEPRFENDLFVLF